MGRWRAPKCCFLVTPHLDQRTSHRLQDERADGYLWPNLHPVDSVCSQVGPKPLHLTSASDASGPGLIRGPPVKATLPSELGSASMGRLPDSGQIMKEEGYPSIHREGTESKTTGNAWPSGISRPQRTCLGSGGSTEPVQSQPVWEQAQKHHRAGGFPIS